jgi:hypothetical protein
MLVSDVFVNCIDMCDYTFKLGSVGLCASARVFVCDRGCV